MCIICLLTVGRQSLQDKSNLTLFINIFHTGCVLTNTSDTGLKNTEYKPAAARICVSSSKSRNVKSSSMSSVASSQSAACSLAVGWRVNHWHRVLLIDSHVRVRPDLNNFLWKGSHFSGRIPVFNAADLLYYCQLSLLTPPITSRDFLLVSLTVEMCNQRWSLPSLGHLSVAGCQVLHCAG